MLSTFCFGQFHFVGAVVFYENFMIMLKYSRNILGIVA